MKRVRSQSKTDSPRKTKYDTIKMGKRNRKLRKNTARGIILNETTLKQSYLNIPKNYVKTETTKAEKY